MKRMKKLLSVILVSICLAMLCSCNQQIFDFELKFTKAFVRWPDGKTEIIDVYKWNDYEGEQIQIIDHDGNVFVFNSVNIVLYNDTAKTRHFDLDQERKEDEKAK